MVGVGALVEALLLGVVEDIMRAEVLVSVGSIPKGLMLTSCYVGCTKRWSTKTVRCGAP